MPPPRIDTFTATGDGRQAGWGGGDGGVQGERMGVGGSRANAGRGTTRGSSRENEGIVLPMIGGLVGCREYSPLAGI